MKLGLLLLRAALLHAAEEPCALQRMPVGLQPPIEYAPFALRLSLNELRNAFIVRASASALSLSADLGTAETEGEGYALQRLSFVRGGGLRVADREFAAELRVEGTALSGKTLELTALFELGGENTALLDLHLRGEGLRGLQPGDRRMVTAFSLTALFAPNARGRFLRFTAAGRADCRPTLHFVHFTTFELSPQQLGELAAEEGPAPFPQLPGLRVTHNSDAQSVRLDEFPRTQRFNYQVLDERVQSPQFDFTPSTASSEERRRALMAGDSPPPMGFELYAPPAGREWGWVPAGALMPWELPHVSLDELGVELAPFKPVVAPLPGYLYRPFFFYRSARGSSRNGRTVYVPHLVIVPADAPDLAQPTVELTLRAPGYETDVTVPILRESEGTPEPLVDSGSEHSLSQLVTREKERLDAEARDSRTDEAEELAVEVLKQRVALQASMQAQSAKEQLRKSYESQSLKGPDQPPVEPITSRKLDHDIAVAFNAIGTKKIFNEVVLRVPPLSTPFNVLPLECADALWPLPPRSGILNVPDPAGLSSEHVERSKYVVLGFCPTKNWSKAFTKIYAPVWTLVHEQYRLHGRKRIPFVTAAAERDFSVQVADLVFTVASFAEVLAEKRIAGNEALNVEFVDGIVAENVFRQTHNLTAVARPRDQRAEELAVAKEVMELKAQIANGGLVT